MDFKNLFSRISTKVKGLINSLAYFERKRSGDSFWIGVNLDWNEPKDLPEKCKNCEFYQEFNFTLNKTFWCKKLKMHLSPYYANYHSSFCGEKLKQ